MRWAEGFGTYALFVGAFLLAFAIVPRGPHTPAIVASLALVPYAVVLGAVLALRASGHPRFPIGSLPQAARRAWVWWSAELAIATLLAARAGFFSAHSLRHWAENASSIVEAPIVEEIAFRGAILTALNLTPLGGLRLLGLRGGTLLQALLFAAMHLLNLLGGAPPSAVAPVCLSALIPGLLCGYLYQRTGNLWYGVAIHAFGNYSQVA